MKVNMFEMIEEIQKIERRLQGFIQPLNDRLKIHKMRIWWNPDYKMWFINKHEVKGGSGVSFDMSDSMFDALMSTPDDKLIKYCKEY